MTCVGHCYIGTDTAFTYTVAPNTTNARLVIAEGSYRQS